MPRKRQQIEPNAPRHRAAAEIESRMERAGLDMRKLSRLARLGETTVRDILIGRSMRPQHDTLDKIAVVLGCSVQDLTEPSPVNDLRLDAKAAEFQSLARHVDAETVDAVLALLRIQAAKATKSGCER